MTSIRQGSTADLADIVRIEEESFAEPWTTSAFAGLFADDKVETRVVEENSQITGFIFWYQSSDGWLYVMDVAVDPSSRRTGTGRLLMDAVLAHAQQTGNGVHLHVQADNEPAIALYKELGFVQCAYVEGYYPDGADALHMALYA